MHLHLVSGTGTLYGIHQDSELEYLMCKIRGAHNSDFIHFPSIFSSSSCLFFSFEKEVESERLHAGSKAQSSASYIMMKTRLRSPSLDHGILRRKGKLFRSSSTRGTSMNLELFSPLHSRKIMFISVCINKGSSCFAAPR